MLGKTTNAMTLVEEYFWYNGTRMDAIKAIHDS
jgi:hypothetical protein